MRGSKTARAARKRRHVRVRERVTGTAARPRLDVFRSLNHIYAQIIDDETGVTICEASTRNRDLRDRIETGGNIAAARVVGVALAEQAKAKNVERVCFDRNGYRYHGRLKALAEAAREGGLKF